MAGSAKPRDSLERDPPEKEGPKERKKPSFGPNETIQDRESWVSKNPKDKAAKLSRESRAEEQNETLNERLTPNEGGKGSLRDLRNPAWNPQHHKGKPIWLPTRNPEQRLSLSLEANASKEGRGPKLYKGISLCEANCCSEV